MLIVIVTGSRRAHVNNSAHVEPIEKALHEEWNDTGDIGSKIVLFHGAAAGVDTIADKWGRTWSHIVAPHPANWERGKNAGMERNRLMLDNAQRLAKAMKNSTVVCLAFPVDGAENIGTYACAREAQKRGIKVKTLVLPKVDD